MTEVIGRLFDFSGTGALLHLPFVRTALLAARCSA